MDKVKTCLFMKQQAFKCHAEVKPSRIKTQKTQQGKRETFKNKVE